MKAIPINAASWIQILEKHLDQKPTIRCQVIQVIQPLCSVVQLFDSVVKSKDPTVQGHAPGN